MDKEWNLLADVVPNPNIHGGKLLVYRIMNKGQLAMAYSILDTTHIRFCEPTETWWQELPKPPVNQ